ncbi:MAG: hypothetical protein HQM08_24140 [Candidatus Riflebacteria bacterium]|nr:hypothetical protein [Candidatus Riflebacteria bacterium]
MKYLFTPNNTPKYPWISTNRLGFDGTTRKQKTRLLSGSSALPGTCPDCISVELAGFEPATS